MRATGDVLERVYALPVEMRVRLAFGRRVSLITLVSETGYPDVRTDVDVAAVRAGLRKRSAILQSWLRYSTEKVETWGWFFEVDRRGTYAVGLKTGFSEKTRCEITDPWAACASFIKEELDAIVGCAQTSPR
jgi:hypothetical protein